jgi:hypothetical protein
MSCYTCIDIWTNAEEPMHAIGSFLQHFFHINITKNSHPFLVFQRLNLVKTLKFDKVIAI